MTATNKTENYKLSQFVGTDRPTWLGDYNGDMSKIDAQLKRNADDIASAAGGLTSVSHTADLTGDGTSGSPLGVADAIARAEDIPSLDGYATTESVTQAIAEAIADRLTAGDIKAGSGINIETSGNQVTISYMGDGGADESTAVAHDDTLTGDGTSTTPLGVVDGTMITPSRAAYGKFVDFNDLTAYGVYDVRAEASSTNNPVSTGLNGGMLVIPAGYNESVFQIALARDARPGLFVRSFAALTSAWTGWSKIAFTSDIPDVSALTSRIAELERQVAALAAPATPAATGLTAKQLDGQWLDGYNIVRVGGGTPASSKETEEYSQ